MVVPLGTARGSIPRAPAVFLGVPVLDLVYILAIVALFALVALVARGVERL